ncbi:MAG: 50S ribosomal protein L6 [Mycoplasmataceae bacterium]|jgi:large subunit ribosomal protein L6|nr:50S ribosomal protein L6 [Mycoplasmataceae bacterium]
MSRKGLKPIIIPQGTTVSINDNVAVVKGNLGTLTVSFPNIINVAIDDNHIKVTRQNDEKQTKMYHGTVASNIANAINGVTIGYTIKLKIVGVGYKAILGGKTLEVHAGYSGSGPRKVQIPNDIKVTVPTPTEIIVFGYNKENVGQFAATVRKIRPPEPYKGKGIMYSDEIIIRKVGKTAEGTKK